MIKFVFKLIAIICLISVVISCANNSNENGNEAKEKVSASTLLAPQQFKDKMEELNNELVLDLRSHGELHRVGPIKGAQNLDFNNGRFKSAIPQLDKNTPVMLYCAGGNRSSEAAKQLNDAGFKEVYDLQGGVTAWKNAGFQVARHSH